MLSRQRNKIENYEKPQSIPDVVHYRTIRVSVKPHGIRRRPESYRHLTVEKRGIPCCFKTSKSRKCYHLLGRWDWRKQLWNRRARLFAERPSSRAAGGNKAATGQYALRSQPSGQGSFYDLSRRHEPAEADPIYGAPDLRFKTEGKSPEKFV